MNEKKLGQIIGLMLVFFVLPFFLILANIDVMMVLIVWAWSYVVYKQLVNFSENIFFICFLLSFFIFLVSGDFVEQISNQSYWLTFSAAAVMHSRVCLLISTIFLYVGYRYKLRNSTVKVTIGKSRLFPEDRNFIFYVRYISKILFYITYLFLIITTIDKVYFSLLFSYDEYYLSYVSHFPRIITKIGDFAPIAMCFFLGTFPEKKEAKPIVSLFFIYAAIAMLVGQRGAFIYNAVFLIGYLVYRNKNDSDEIWISRRQIFLIICMLPVLLVFLMVFQYIRSNEPIVYTSFFDSLISFFVNIGASSKVIKYGYEFKEQLNQSFKFFSLGDTLTYLKNSDVICFFTGYDAPAMHTARYALEGNNFGEIITYLAFPNKYLAGYGLGSSFVAELFADFGYIGIAIGSMIYGGIFRKISNMDQTRWLSNFIKLYTMLNIIKAPRGEFDRFLVSFVNVLNFSFMVILLILAKIMYDRQTKNVRGMD